MLRARATELGRDRACVVTCPSPPYLPRSLKRVKQPSTAAPPPKKKKTHVLHETNGCLRELDTSLDAKATGVVARYYMNAELKVQGVDIRGGEG